MQLRFESAANLISLNIDLTFSCKDPAALLAERGAQAERATVSSLVAYVTERAEGAETLQKQDDALRSLG